MQVVSDQRFPHKYIQRVRKDGKWVYVYSQSTKSFKKATADTTEHKVVIAQGKPTSILIDSGSMIVYGPPTVIGKRLFKNNNPNKNYWGIARAEGGGTDVYFYTEDHLKKAITKKAAKLLNFDRARKLIDAQAEIMMTSTDPKKRQYGLAMWMNNNSALRIGAHEEAASVDPKERAKIINQARIEGWTEKDKMSALQASRKQTFGLLTLRVGHVELNGDKRQVHFHFLGKGAKQVDTSEHVVALTPQAFETLKLAVYNKRPEEKVFPDVNYKWVWRFYKKLGVSPHAVRGAYADTMVRQMISDYKVKDAESGRAALSRFHAEMQQKISDRLGHTRQMTEKSYLTQTTQNALQEFKSQLGSAAIESAGDDKLDDLALCLVWQEVGAGNEIL